MFAHLPPPATTCHHPTAHLGADQGVHHVAVLAEGLGTAQRGRGGVDRSREKGESREGRQAHTLQSSRRGETAVPDRSAVV
jgi:hypothetical protein